MKISGTPEVTIAICNKNMADTLSVSLRSVLDQVDSMFEVLVIDDGSTDSSAQILSELRDRYDNLRLLLLPKDPSRKLGETRNISIRESAGTWVIFHIDTDDFINPGIVEFSQNVISLSSQCSRKFLYAGKQIHMAEREFLIEHGPFANIYRGEDRELYERLAVNKNLIFIEHSRFITRMKRKTSKLLKKRIIDEIDQTSNDIRKSMSFRMYLDSLKVQTKHISFKLILIRVIIGIFIYRSSLKKGRISVFQKNPEYSSFSEYRKNHTHTFQEWDDIFKTQKY